jgi:uncharacterized protein YgiM (DUF1202 family)
MKAASLVMLSVLALGCSNLNGNGELTGADDSTSATSEDALTGDVTAGATLRTTTSLNLREGAGTNFPVIVVMPEGATVTVRETTPTNGFYAVKYGDTEGWASGMYLSVETASPTTPAPPPPPGAPAAKQKIGGPAVLAHVQNFANVSCAANDACHFTIGTYEGHQPTANRAIDMMQSPGGVLPTAENVTRGTKLADWGVANGGAHRVDYVIWRQRINSLDGRGWRMMEDRGSLTQNHFDHVHVSFNP